MDRQFLRGDWPYGAAAKNRFVNHKKGIFMENGLLEILNQMAETGEVRCTMLNNLVTGFKAIKKTQKGKPPTTMAEVRFVLNHEAAVDLCRGPDCENVAFIVWLDREEFEAMSANKKAPANLA